MSDEIRNMSVEPDENQNVSEFPTNAELLEAIKAEAKQLEVDISTNLSISTTAKNYLLRRISKFDWNDEYELIKIQTLYDFASQTNTPNEQLEAWINSENEDLRIIAAATPNISPQIIDLLLSFEISLPVISALIQTQGRNLSESQLTAVLQKLSPYFNNENGTNFEYETDQPNISNLAADIASLPNLSEANLAILTNINDDEFYTQQTIATRENLPISIINLLIAPNRDIRVIIALIEGPSAIPDEILIRLASNAEEKIREAVANRTDLPFSVIQTLLNQSNVTSKTKIALATQPNLSNELVAQFSNDTIPEVRAALASRSDASESLAYDPSPIVRIAVARNASTKNEIRQQLLTDSNSEVREAAMNTIK